jgi:4-hydroxyphenylacetate 3-monooxygenase
VLEKLGELASLISIVEGMELASIASTTIDKNGVARPNPRFLYGPMGLQAELFPRAVQILRELAGGGVLQVPSTVNDLTGSQTAADIQRYIRSPEVPAEERIKLMKLAWDFVGTEFGGRQLQYEMFYAGAPHVAKSYACRNYGFEEPLKLVNDFLASYSAKSDA